ncbi:MAG: AMP-binding protein [Nocardioidaceae bacterium]|nr:AMP-binding protein [Nocardioidaceae bacterium]
MSEQLPVLDRISDYVAHWARERPDREALVDAVTRTTYRELREEVDRTAAALVAAGVRHGDRVAMLGRPRPACFAHFLATASTGAIWVGLNPKYTPDEVAAVVEDCRPVLLFALLDLDEDTVAVLNRAAAAVPGLRVVVERDHPGLGEHVLLAELLEQRCDETALAAARAAVAGADAAAMIYTSGTTGRSKGALVPHRGLARCGVIQSSRWYGDAPRKLCDLPLNHIGGLGDICTSILTAGGTTVFMDRFDPAGALRTVEAERLTHLYCIPTQLLAMVATPEWEHCDLSSLEWILWGGAAAPQSLLEKLARRVPRLGTSYSLTESVGSVTYTDEDAPLDVLSWSVGKVDPRYDVRVDESGEILIRGDHITLGYFGREEATREAIDADGWLHTGDLARIEPDGNVRLVGRLKEMYKSGGYNVYPREVESALEEHPAVTLASVVGVPDERWGEIGVAFVVAAGVDGAELEAYLRERLANYKIPKQIRIETELPKLPIGKVDKAALRRAVTA